MKKTFLAILLAASANVFAQTKTEEIPQKNNELRLNLLNSLLGSVDFQYERFLNNNSSLGLNAGLGYGNEWSEPYSPRFNVSPNFRLYFSKKRAAGFFIEGSAVVSQNKIEKRIYYYTPQNYYPYDYTSVISKKMNLGLGVSAGYKLVNKSNFVASVKAGMGRYLTNQNNGSGMDEVYPAFELSIGKRF